MVNSPDLRARDLQPSVVSCSEPSAAALTTTFWRPRLELSVGDWARQGRWLGALGRGSGWWIGDWVRYGNARYGDRYGRAARLTGYDVQSLMNMAFVAGRFEVSRRRDGLSFSHHAEVAGLPAEEQELWLDRAEVARLSVRSLRSELRRARHRATLRAQRNGAATPGRPTPAKNLDETEPQVFTTDATGSGRAALGLGATDGGEPAASGVKVQMVCPECGHHFNPPADREGSDPDPGNGTRGRMPQLASDRPA
jgi:hypothetical protein